MLQGDANATLLDTYQQEREPHVRQIIEGAIAMGRVVCVQDQAAAAMRDQGMIAARAAKASGANDPLPGLPGFGSGFLHPSKRAGELLPQTTSARTADGKHGRLDDLLGDGFWLLTKEQTKAQAKNAKTFVIGRDITDETGRLDEWLRTSGASAVLVRPDRYVFGSGEPEALCAALDTQLVCSAQSAL